jgi:hypothetical protein
MSVWLHAAGYRGDNVSQQAMTAFAQAAIAVGDLVSAKFAGMRFTGRVSRIVKVQTPNVQSTGGGRQARESVVLLPENGDSSQALTAGFIDVGLRAVELRTYAALDAAYRQRHRQALDLPPAEYDSFSKDLQAFLGNEGYVVKVLDVVDTEGRPGKGAGDAGLPAANGRILLVGGVAAAVVVGVVAAVVLFR